jgi:hypothetical protein
MNFKMNKTISLGIHSNVFSILIITIIVLATYFKTVFSGLIFLDDDTLVLVKFVDNGFIENIKNSITSNYLGGHYYRPITLITLLIDSVFVHNTFVPFHITNLFLHLATSIFIFLIIKRLGYNLKISLLIAIIFSIAPININAVSWIAGRGDLLTAFLSSVAFYFFLKYLHNGNVLPITSVYVLLLFAILAKEASLLVPFLFLFFYFLEKKELTLNKKTVATLLIIVIVFGTYFLLRYLLQPGVHIDKFSFSEYLNNIFVLPETISKFFIPYFIKALSSFDLFATISGIIILIVLIAIPFPLSSISKSRYYFGLIWFGLLLLPGMVFRTMQQDGFYYWDCRSYLPLVGLSITLAEIIKAVNFQKHKKIIYAIIVLYLISFATTTFIKIDLYKNPVTYWSAVKSDFPDRFLPYVGLYNYNNHKKDFTNAENQLLAGIKIKPKEFTLRQLLINFYTKRKENGKAFVVAKNAIDSNVDGFSNLFEDYILLAIELNNLNEIESLIAKHSSNGKLNNKIKEILGTKILQLNDNGDAHKANLLSKIKLTMK